MEFMPLLKRGWSVPLIPMKFFRGILRFLDKIGTMKLTVLSLAVVFFLQLEMITLLNLWQLITPNLRSVLSVELNFIHIGYFFV